MDTRALTCAPYITRPAHALPDTTDLTLCVGQLQALARDGGLHPLDVKKVVEALSTPTTRQAIVTSRPETQVALARALVDIVNIATTRDLSLPFGAVRGLLLLGSGLQGNAGLPILEAIADNLDLRSHGDVIARGPYTNIMTIAHALKDAPPALASRFMGHAVNSLRLMPSREFGENLTREQIKRLEQSRDTASNGARSATAAPDDADQPAYERALISDTRQYVATLANLCAALLPENSVEELLKQICTRLNVTVPQQAFANRVAMREAAVNLFKQASLQFYQADNGDGRTYLNLHYCGRELGKAVLENLVREGKTNLEVVVGGRSHWQGPGNPPIRRMVHKFANDHGLRVDNFGGARLRLSAVRETN